MKFQNIDCTTKATLEILIREIQDILKQPHLRLSQIEKEITELLDSWVKANDLHPERVQVFGPFTSSNANNFSDLNVTSSNTYNLSFYMEES
jgi:hypothetical protein